MNPLAVQVILWCAVIFTISIVVAIVWGSDGEF